MQTIKHLFLSAGILILALSNTQAGNKNLKEKLDAMSGVTSFSFSKEMIDFIDLDIDIEEHMKELEGDFEEIRFYVFSSETPELAKRKEEVKQLLKKDYREVEFDSNAQKPEALLYIEGSRKRITEAHMMVLDSDDDSFVLISFVGNVNVQDKE